MIDKPEIVFVFPAALGGVASFNYNIINYAPYRSKFYTKVILLKAKEDNRAIFSEVFEVDETVIFNYSFKENQFFVLKRLVKLLGTKEGAVVCDNSLTLQACFIYENNKTVFHLVHDYFYVNQSINLHYAIDVAVAHASFFADCVYAANPSAFGKHSFYIPYGIKQLPEMPFKPIKEKLNLFFLGRLCKGKGVEHLYTIDEMLIKRGVMVDWTIIGTGNLEEELINVWRNKSNLQFNSPKTTNEVYQLLQKQDIFIFPTEFEGTPVAIMEAMSNGCVTIVNDLPGGIRDLVTQSVGFRIPLNNFEKYVDAISLLHINRNRLAEMQQNAWRFAKENYNVEINALKYFGLFCQYGNFKRKREKNRKLQLSKLDKPFLPNSVVRILRSI